MSHAFCKKITRKYIASQIESGNFQNASELVRDALRLHQVYRHRVIAELRAEIEKGWEGQSSRRTITDIINEKKKKTQQQ